MGDGALAFGRLRSFLEISSRGFSLFFTRHCVPFFSKIGLGRTHSI
jgi:hypothetical protein